LLYISSGASQYKDIPKVIEEFVSFNIFNIELSGGLKYYEGWKKDLTNLKRKYNLNLLIHNYFPPVKGKQFVLNYCSDDDIKKRTLSHFKNALSLIEKISTPLYSIHPGYRGECEPVKGREAYKFDIQCLTDRRTAYENFYNNIDLMSTNLSKIGGKLAVENTFPFPDTECDVNLISTPDEIYNFIKHSRNYDNIGFLFDLGHFNVCSKICNFDARKVAHNIISKNSDKIFELHLSENDSTGDHHKITTQDSWQIKLLKEFPEILKNVPITFEWDYNGRIKEIAEEYRSIAKILLSEDI